MTVESTCGIDFTKADMMANDNTEPAINKYPLVDFITLVRVNKKINLLKKINVQDYKYWLTTVNIALIFMDF